MALVPYTKAGKIAFYTSKITPWSTNAVAIGTTAAAVTDLETKLDAAVAAMAAQEAASQAAKTATANADYAVEVLAAAGADIIKSIRAKGATGGQTVWDLAQIPAPAAPTPVNTLGKPTDFKVELKDNGGVELKWKCASPRATGTVYQVWRRIGLGEFAYLGGSGEKKYLDLTIPAGVTNVTYQIQAVRSTAVGEWSQFNVSFSLSGGVTVTAEPVMKQAA